MGHLGFTSDVVLPTRLKSLFPTEERESLGTRLRLKNDFTRKGRGGGGAHVLKYSTSSSQGFMGVKTRTQE